MPPYFKRTPVFSIPTIILRLELATFRVKKQNKTIEQKEIIKRKKKKKVQSRYK